MNNGVCTEVDSHTVSCECTTNFFGPKCEHARPVCGGLFKNLNGTLQYPAANIPYDHGLNCAFVIITNVTRVLNLTFTNFDVEASQTCRFDFLQVRLRKNFTNILYNAIIKKKM